MELINLAIILFLIMDPIGNVGSFLTLLQDLPPKRKRFIILREMLIALAVIFLFNYIGEMIFSILHVSETTVQLASGAILFLVAIKILFPSVDSPRANLPAGEPFITPLAIPLIAGPCLLASVMLFAHLESSQADMLGAISLSWLAALGVLLGAGKLQRTIGTNGLMAAERLMGMVLIMLAIQRFSEGIQQFVRTCALT